MDSGSLLGLLAVFALVAANGFFVAGEFALVKVRKTRVDQLVAEGRGGARIVQQQIGHLDSYIAATQLGITLASLALGWIGEPALAGLIDGGIELVTGQSAHEAAEGLAIGVSFALITGFHIVLGELVPKSIALQRSEGTALLVARPLFLFALVFRPIIAVMNGVGNALVRMLGLHAAGEHAAVHSVEELEMLVVQSGEAGVLDKAEEVLLHRVFDFAGKTAYQVMTPRTEVVGVRADATFDDLARLVAEEHYTRYPVYEGTLDRIVGVVHVKDLVGLLLNRPPEESFSVRQVLRRVLDVPESLPIEKLLPQMQAKKVHIAVVIDEYGGTSGIVTLEDIIEEIVGEVEDEFDIREKDQPARIETLPDGSFAVDGMLAVEEFCERFGVGCEDNEYETIGGYVFGQLGRAPEIGDEIVAGSYRLRVDALDHLRIARIRVTPQQDGRDAQTDGAENGSDARASARRS